MVISDIFRISDFGPRCLEFYFLSFHSSFLSELNHSLAILELSSKDLRRKKTKYINGPRDTLFGEN